MNAVDFRIRAGVCEQMAKQTQDRDIKVQWEELAMQWHLLPIKPLYWLKKTNKWPRPWGSRGLSTLGWGWGGRALI